MKISKYYKIWLFAFVVSCCLFSCAKSPDTVSGKPNIVIILADDMGYGDLGCYNSDSKIPTPNIDQLASQGVRFTDAHAPGAWCSPSRFGLVTGRYPGNTPMNTRERSLINPGQETLATMMKRNGYRTACIGKWHLGFEGVDWENPKEVNVMKGGPIEKGFDYFFGMHASLDIPPYFYIENDRAVEAPTGYVEDHASANPTSKVSGAFFRAGAISPDFSHEEVLDKFLDKAYNFLNDLQMNHKDTPFFLYFPLTAPHTPWMPKDEFKGSSGAGEYGDFVVQVDDLVGQFVAFMRENGLLENTIIFFSSDNGPVWFQADVRKFNHKSVGSLKGIKSDMWEGGSRVPFIVSGVYGDKKGIQSDQLICFTDLMATLSDLVGDETLIKADFNSYSFLPVLLDPLSGKTARNELVIENKAYRKDNWKFIDGSGQGGITLRYAPDRDDIEIGHLAGEMYNLETDISEQNNLYDEYPEKVSEMKKRLQQVLNE